MRIEFAKRFLSVFTALSLLISGFSICAVEIPADKLGSTVNYALNSIEDIKENFVSYYAPSGKNIEELDAEGNPLFSACDAEDTWNVANGILSRFGEGDFAGSSGKRSAPAVLYFKEKQNNFTLSYDFYIPTSPGSGWHWASLGFGASEIGKNFSSDGYMAYIEREGTVRMYNKSVEAPYVSSQKLDDYKAVSYGNWIHAEFSVIDSVLTLSYTYPTAAGDKTFSCTKALDGYNGGGYIYLHSNTQNMQFKNIILTSYKTVTAVDVKDYYYAEIGSSLSNVLPQNVLVSFDDLSSMELPISWSSDTFDGNKVGYYTVIGSVTPTEDMIIPSSLENISTCVEISEHSAENTQTFNFKTLSDIENNFYCYASPNTYNFGAVDDSGNSYLVPVSADTVWKIDSSTGGLIRTGDGEWAGGAQSKGASLLYLKDKCDDFELTYEYCLSEVNNSYRWAGVGFGAENLGDAFKTDSYFAVVQKEGDPYIHLRRLEGQTALAKYGYKNEAYAATVNGTNLENNTDTWHSMTVKVVAGRCYISYDGGEAFSCNISSEENGLYKNGYIYLFASTEGMKLKNIRLTRFYQGDTEHTVEVWPKEYNTTAYTTEQISNIRKNDKEFSFDVKAGEINTTLYVTFPKEGGVRLNSSESGFFEPKALNQINYNVSSDNITLVSGDNRADFTYTESGFWKLQLYKGNAKSVALSSENLIFGLENGKLEKIKYSFPIAEGEYFYGLGERYNSVLQNGYTVTLWNHDPTYHADTGTDRTDSYANVPLIHSTLGYTLFFNSTEYAEADIGYTSADEYSFDFNGSILDLYFYTDTPEENIADYTSLTGKPFVPPKWAFSYWMGSGRNLWIDGDNTDEVTQEQVSAKLDSIIGGYNALETPMKVFYSEGAYIDNAPESYKYITDNGIKALSWNRCSTRYDTMLTLLSCSPTKLPLIRMQNEENKFFGNLRYAYIDYSNPLARSLVKKIYQGDVKNGLRGLMVDMGEYIGEDTVFYNGKDGGEMHNLYSYYYAKTINEAFTEMCGKDFVLFERSGCAGSQAYSALFGGDQAAKWSGLKLQLNGLLTSSASGYSISGYDIGGLHGRPTDELYMRWVQFSAFNPLMREHGNTADDGLPYTYSEAAQANFKAYYNLRENLVDYIYSAALSSGNSGIPITKALAFAYPEQDSLKTVEDEYIFCDDMLVAPVLESGTVIKSVTLPEGKWYDLYNGKSYSGGEHIVGAPDNKIPVYIKSGSIIPMMLSSSLNLTDKGDRKTLLITAPEADSVYEHFTASDVSSAYSLELNSPDSFSVLCDTATDASMTYIYGFEANAISVNGIELDKVEGGSSQIGFYTLNGNTVINLPENTTVIDLFKGDNIYQNQNVSEIYPNNSSELSSYFTSFAVDKDHSIEAVGENGEKLFKQVNTADFWNIPYEGVIEKTSTAEYKTNVKRNGASAHYFENSYTDFELSFSFSYNTATSGWRWISAGFGAQNAGASYYDSGYLALGEQEGYVKILGDSANGSISTYRLYNDRQENYPTLNNWYTFKLKVEGDVATITYGDVTVSQSLKNYNGGYVYLHAFADGIRYKDIRIVDLSNKSTSGTRSSIGISSAISGGNISVNYPAALAGRKITVVPTAQNGYVAAERSFEYIGYNNGELVSQKLSPNSDGSLSFIMPTYPIIIKAHFYIPADVNRDGASDIRDLVRHKKKTADSGVLADSYAADMNSDGSLTADDVALLARHLLSHK